MTNAFEVGPPITGPIFYIPGPGPVYLAPLHVFNLTEPPRRQVEDSPKVLRDNVATRTRTRVPEVRRPNHSAISPLMGITVNENLQDVATLMVSKNGGHRRGLTLNS